MRSLVLYLSLAVATAANAETDWERWLQNPTSVNAERVSAIQYTATLSETQAGPKITRDLDRLSTRVRSGQESALRLAIRLTDTTPPGANLEDLHEMLGAAVRPHARKLLLALKKSPRTQGCPGVGFLGASFVDQPGRRREETIKRRTALISVQEPALAPERIKCLAVLKDDA